MLFNNQRVYNRIRQYRRHIAEDDLTNDTTVVIDTSCLFHSIFNHPNHLAVDLCELDPTNKQESAAYANRLAAALIHYVDSLNLPSRRYVWVVEGDVSQSKPNHPVRANNRAHNLNRGMRGHYLASKHSKIRKYLLAAVLGAQNGG